MRQRSPRRSRTNGATRTPGTGWRGAVGVVAALNAVAALGGAVGLASGWLDLGSFTQRLPFGSAVLGGVALLLVVAVPQAVVATLAARRSPAAAAGSVLAGGLLIGWILVEVAFLRVVAGLQVTYLAVGAAQVALGLGLRRHDRGVRIRELDESASDRADT